VVAGSSKRGRTRSKGAVVARLRHTAEEVLGPRPPEQGERAWGHSVSGAIISVPECQPLAADNIWRVILAGETVGRLVKRSSEHGWMLLQADDLTDLQEAALAEAGRGEAASGLVKAG